MFVFVVLFESTYVYSEYYNCDSILVNTIRFLWTVFLS